MENILINNNTIISFNNTIIIIKYFSYNKIFNNNCIIK